MADPGATIRKHSVMLAGHRTSVSLEDAYWSALKQIAKTDGRSLNDLVAEIDRVREGNLSSALRVFVLRRLQGAASGG
jgi:predicted DNA-binding ribbon-helix-helix protein